MLRTTSLTPRSGLAGLGLILLAVLVAGGLVLFLVTGTSAIGGRRSEAAERGPRAAAELPEEPDDERGAPPVELVPAGTNALAGQGTETVSVADASAPQVVADAGANEFALAASEGDGKVEGPALKYARGEGKAEIVDGKEQRRDRRADRRERQAEEAAAGILPEKKAVESPKKNGDRSQIQKKGSQTGKPERRPKKDAPKEETPEEPQDG